jgi:hypothetical protein
MKKIFYLLVITILAVFALTGCNSGNDFADMGGSVAPTENNRAAADAPQGNGRNNTPSLADELQGRWERTASSGEYEQADFGTVVAVVFNGDSVVEYRTFSFIADRALTQNDLDEGAHFDLITSTFEVSIGNGFQWDNSGMVQRELIKVEQREHMRIEIDGEFVEVDAYSVTVQERREGTFALSPESDRIEIFWGCERGHTAGRFELTLNALAPDEINVFGMQEGRRGGGWFNRVEG